MVVSEAIVCLISPLLLLGWNLRLALVFSGGYSISRVFGFLVSFFTFQIFWGHNSRTDLFGRLEILQSQQLGSVF